jgi:hypothetical protein
MAVVRVEVGKSKKQIHREKRDGKALPRACLRQAGRQKAREE